MNLSVSSLFNRELLTEVAVLERAVSAITEERDTLKIRKSVLSGKVVIADDTRFTDATGSTAKKLPSYKRGCLWGLFGEKSEVSYTFAPSRTYQSCKDVLSDFSGYLVVDAYQGFDEVANTKTGVTLAHCNNHARRYFIIAESSDPQRANEALNYYQALYKTVSQKNRGWIL